MPKAATPPAERFFALDVLRGFALLGVFLINFAYGDTQLQQPTPIASRWDAATSWLLINVFEDRSWPLFSLSFGIGFSLLLLRSQRRGEPFLAPYLRRLAVLFVFGWFTYVVLQGIPILNRYAIGGLVLLPFVRASNRTVLYCAALMFLLSVADAPLIRRYEQRQIAQHRLELEQRGGPRAVEEEAARAAQARQAQEQSDRTVRYVPLVLQQTSSLGRWVTSLWFYVTREVQIVALFLLGLYVGRAGVMEQPERHLRLLRVTAVAGLLVGLMSWGVHEYIKVWPRGSLRIELFQRFDYAAFYLAWSLCYGALIVLLTLRPAMRRWMMPLAYTGRLALSNFLVQFALGFLVLSRFGLGWSHRFGTASRFALVLAVFAGQVAFSGLWLRRFRFGPAEWLWRVATYGPANSPRERVQAIVA